MTWQTRWPDKKHGCNPLTIFFLTKTTSFWFIKKMGLTLMTWWPDQNPMIQAKLVTWAWDRIYHQVEFKNSGMACWEDLSL
jgi:hypothetical protein